MSEANIHVIDLPATDMQVTEDFAIRIRAALDVLCALENEVVKAGFAVTYQVGFNGFGQKSVQTLSVLKRLA